jgi:hypothetical protein
MGLSTGLRAGNSLVITNRTLAPATVSIAYAQTLGAVGGKLPYTWALLGGGFPDGVALNPRTGQISGTPTASGAWVYSYPFRVYIGVTDATGASSACAFSISVLRATAPPTTPPVPPPATACLSITTASLTNAVVGTVYSQTLTAGGGKPPYTWVVAAGGLPDGLTLVQATGQITGTPTASGSWVYSYPFRAYITVTDSARATASSAFAISVLPPAITKYTLTVVKGTGSGTFAAGASVTISANPAPAGQVFKSWTGATFANPVAPTTTLVMPATNLTVTATYTSAPPPVTQYTLTVVNGSGSGTFSAGTTATISANTPPTGQVFKGWLGATVTDPLSASTTLIMPAANVTVTATYGTSAPPPTTIPQPVTGHPRLWITAGDVPKFRSWATSSNPLYQQGLLPLLNKAVADYNSQFFPGGVANPNYPDLGDTQGYAGLVTEQYALIFAFHSLIDPSPAARIQYAQRARNLIMVAMDQAAQGAQSGAPFRDPLFSTYNRANFTSEAWPLVVDWIYNATDSNNQPILTAQDKATIRKVFMRWAGECLNAYTTGGDHPEPIGVANSRSLLPGGNAYRMASNNYYLGHARLVTLMSLAFDPSDDPALDAASPVTVLGNSLRSYIANATGAWLYQEFAMLGEPADVRAAFGLSANASVGLASGGLPPEGMLYGHSYSFIFGQLLALKTAGFADPVLSGPQAALANNPPVWDRFVHGMIASLVPTAQVYPGYEYMGPVYQMASYGDILRLWMTPDFAQPFALLALLDQKNGDSSRLNAERWFVINALEGGAANLINRVQNPWSYGVQDALLSFLLLDPAAPQASDPRPNFPTSFYDAPQGRLVEHSDWSPNAAMLDFRCSWISINHQQADANQFEFYRKGEWLTKGVANYDNNAVGLTTDYHNTLSLKNWCANGTPANLGWWEGPFWANGSQWQLGGSAGDPTASVSTQPAYTYAFGDTTSLYNRPSQWTPANAALDILHASRSILWLKPDYIVVYDRATSKTPGLFKRFNLALTGAPVLNGNVVTAKTPSGQNLHISVLLPGTANVTSTTIGNALNPMAWLEPSTYRIVIEDPADPTDTRFLHVLQGADAGVGPDTASLFHSGSGSAMDGALVGNTAALFTVNATGPFQGTAYSVPAGITRHFVTGCAPSGFYSVTATAKGSGTYVVIAPAPGGFQADNTGVLAFSF